jgi:hypothetical protein
VDLKVIKSGRRSGKLTSDNNNAIPYQEIITSLPLPSDASQMSCNARGNLLCITSRSSCYVVHLPKKGLEGSLADGMDGIKCRTVAVGSYFHASNSSLTIIQCSWHPRSESHLVVLTSDRRLRIYNITQQFDEPEQEFDLSSPHTSLATRFNAFCFGNTACKSCHRHIMPCAALFLLPFPSYQYAIRRLM